jgi:hypothetical protein
LYFPNKRWKKSPQACFYREKNANVAKCSVTDAGAPRLRASVVSKSIILSSEVSAAALERRRRHRQQKNTKEEK